MLDIVARTLMLASYPGHLPRPDRPAPGTDRPRLRAPAPRDHARRA
jgi:hypothetical protein